MHRRLYKSEVFKFKSKYLVLQESSGALPPGPPPPPVTLPLDPVRDPNVGSQTLHMHMHALHLWCSFSSLDIIHVGPPSKISESMSALKCLLPQSNLLLSISSLLWWWLRTLNEEKLVEEGFGIACLWIPRKLGQLWGMLSSSSGYILK